MDCSSLLLPLYWMLWEQILLDNWSYLGFSPTNPKKEIRYQPLRGMPSFFTTSNIPSNSLSWLNSCLILNEKTAPIAYNVLSPTLVHRKNSAWFSQVHSLDLQGQLWRFLKALSISRIWPCGIRALWPFLWLRKQNSELSCDVFHFFHLFPLKQQLPTNYCVAIINLEHKKLYTRNKNCNG